MQCDVVIYLKTFNKDGTYGVHYCSNQGQKSSIFKFLVTDVQKLTNFSLLVMMVVRHTLVVSLGISSINSRDYSHG